LETLLVSESSEPLDSAGLLYAEHSDQLRFFLLGVLKDPDLAAEALQATFVKVIEHSQTVRAETFKGWLFKVALNEALGIRRLRQRDRQLMQKPVWRPIQADNSPDEAVLHREKIDHVRRQLDRLSPELREVVHLKIFEDLTFSAIAEKLELPLGTVLTRMRTALKILSTRLNRDT
jgi:RNA polymerase sigma-70 factor, ECF subfamily